MVGQVVHGLMGAPGPLQAQHTLAQTHTTQQWEAANYSVALILLQA